MYLDFETAMVRPKKHLGQHFLKEPGIAMKIVDALQADKVDGVIEIGPGTGVLTQFLLERGFPLRAMDVDRESITYLEKEFGSHPQLSIELQDFLKVDIETGQYAIIGNFPYNISSQIFFKVWEEKEKVTEVVCMLQKEVALRIASPHGNKQYGILSVLLQAFYDIEYLFTVKPGSFIPPPKVQSGVIRLSRKKEINLPCDPNFLKVIVKQGFQNRRKTLRNALKRLNLPAEITSSSTLDKRAEQLSVGDFIHLTKQIEDSGYPGKI